MTGAQLSAGLVAVAGVGLLVVLFLGLRRSPKVAVVAWLLVVCFVPVWIGTTLKAFFPAFAIIGVLAAVSLLPALPRVRWSVVDLLLAGVVVVVLVEYALGLTTRTATFDLVVSWATAYLVGRVLPTVLDARWVYGAAGVAFGVVGLLAVVEFATGSNPFITYLGNSTVAYQFWSVLQPRGGVLRAEGAFGHSIALSTSLAIAATLTLGSRFRPWVKTALVGAMVAGTVVSFSRTGMITAALGIVASCLFLREPLSRRYRVSVLLLTLVGAAVAFSSVKDVFLASGGEAEGSALYRSQLLQLVRYVRPFGLSANYNVSTTREVSIGDFGSVDNALLLFALTFGWFATVLVLLVGVAGVVSVLRRRGTPAVIAALAQAPALVTVGLITQYAAAFWFAVGLAVATQVIADRSRRSLRAAARRLPAHSPLLARDPEPVDAR